MTKHNLDRLRELDEEALAEVIREGEMRLQAQFSAAAAADQRATAWAGFVITMTIGAIGATASLVLSGKSAPLEVITGLLSCILGISAHYAMQAFVPTEFNFPGNVPSNWLPQKWEQGRQRDMKQARIEQARCLEMQIHDNVKIAKRAGGKLHDS